MEGKKEWKAKAGFQVKLLWTKSGLVRRNQTAAPANPLTHVRYRRHRELVVLVSVLLL